MTREKKGRKNDFAWIQICNWSIAECTLQPFNHQNLTAHFSLKCLINLLQSINLLNWVGKEASSTVANQNGYKRDREARECKAHKNRSRWEKLTGVTNYFNKEVKEITQKGQILRSRRNRQMKSDQERETMDKTTLCYCTPNLHKLVCKAPCNCVVGYLLVHIINVQNKTL